MTAPFNPSVSIVGFRPLLPRVHVAPMRFEVKEYRKVVHNDKEYTLHLGVQVLDREDPRVPIPLTFYQTFRDGETEEDALRSLFKHAVCHEVDECIRVYGERVFDPHRPVVPHVDVSFSPATKP